MVCGTAPLASLDTRAFRQAKIPLSSKFKIHHFTKPPSSSVSQYIAIISNLSLLWQLDIALAFFLTIIAKCQFDSAPKQLNLEAMLQSLDGYFDSRGEKTTIAQGCTSPDCWNSQSSDYCRVVKKFLEEWNLKLLNQSKNVRFYNVRIDRLDVERGKVVFRVSTLSL